MLWITNIELMSTVELHEWLGIKKIRKPTKIGDNLCSLKICQYANQSEAKEMSELTPAYPTLELIVSSLLVG